MNTNKNNNTMPSTADNTFPDPTLLTIKTELSKHLSKSRYVNLVDIYRDKYSDKITGYIVTEDPFFTQREQRINQGFLLHGEVNEGSAYEGWPGLFYILGVANTQEEVGTILFLRPDQYFIVKENYYFF
jgi:hypothetical protein